MQEKRWLLKNKYPHEFEEKLPGYHPVVLQLLYDRGLDTHEKVDEFLKPDYTQDIHDPFLFKDMAKAVKKILSAIDQQEKILIHGDYDADGVTSVVVLEKTLRRLGAKNLEVFIPHRETDGYGLNLENVKQFIVAGFKLIITVDCGITNVEQVKELKTAGIDTIITDHHLAVGELPKAYAVLNCSIEQEKYPFKKLSGVGMTFKLAQGLFQEKIKKQKSGKRGKIENNNHEAFEKWLLDLVTVGTIGDMVPVLGENRTLVSYGLKVLNKTPRRGLQELIRVSSLSNGHDPNTDIPLGQELYDLNVRNISFQLVPRLNAAGRIDHANLAYRLLTTEDETEAIALARDIHGKNQTRQKIVEQMLAEAKEIIGEVNEHKKILIAAKENWSIGMVGLVAGKLSDEFFRPVLLFTIDGDKYSGSGRSVRNINFNITAALQETKEFLDRFGGHPTACGLGLTGQEKFDKFKKKIITVTDKMLKGITLVPTIEVDAEITLKELNWELWDELEKFEPFAEANSMPLFLVKNVIIEDISTVGKDHKHLRFYLSQNNINQKAISFGTAVDWQDKLKTGDKVDIIVEFGVNEWQGKRELQLKVVDIKMLSSRS